MLKRYLLIALVLVVVDQLTKYAVALWMTPGDSIEITSFFNLVYVFNRGAAFSFLSQASGWQRYFFTVAALAVSVWIVYLLWKNPQRTRFNLALSLVLGGALGNVIDRIRFGAVVDFLDFHAYGYHWPAFNVADSAITCGAILLIWDSFAPAAKRQSQPIKEFP